MIRRAAIGAVRFPRVADMLLGAWVGATAGFMATAHAHRPEAGPVPRAGDVRAYAAPAAGLRAAALSVIDGDTFEARVQAFPGQEIVTRIRLAGLDAPELRGHCVSETAAAKDAARALAELVINQPLMLSDVRGDKYFGRVLARVSSPSVADVSEALVAAGHGRRYAGGRRASWC
jgi:micrococcal nuclease